MSKASEWAKLQVPDIRVGDINVSVTHHFDRTTQAVIAQPRLCMQPQDTNSRLPFYVFLTEEDALKLGRWIIEMFGEGGA